MSKKKRQVVLLKISLNTGIWHFLALESEQDDTGYMKPTKSFSRLMRDVTSS